MMIDLSDYETIQKASAYSWINRMDVAFVVVAKRDFSDCDFKVLVCLGSFLCFRSLQYCFFSQGTNSGVEG